mmetsp:Transcript_15150/g.32132  ORF Transcript_15150/g.32132 Transcript_15150/m.32132 type:complete len:457 (-) Transcript_15150:388-1758(-)
MVEPTLTPGSRITHNISSFYNKKCTMVSFENGKFILRKRDERLHIRSRRSERLRRILAIALAVSFCYFINRRSVIQPETTTDDLLLLRTARHADVKSHYGSSGVGGISFHSSSRDSNEDSDDQVRNAVGPQSQSQSHDEKKKSPDQVKEVERSSNKCNISLNKNYLKYLSSLEPIPQKVHIFFPDKNYWNKEPSKSFPFVEHSILSLKKLNPDWNVTVYDDAMIDDVIRNAAHLNLISREERDILVGKKDGGGGGSGGNDVVVHKGAHVVERSDIARLLLMYTEGGLYLDSDRLVSKSMEDVIPRPSATRMCLPTFNDVNFCQDLICSSRGNDLFLDMIKEASKIRVAAKRRNGWIKAGGLYDLGPVLYNRHILIRVFGEDEKTFDKCGNDDFSLARDMIVTDSDEVIITAKETRCNDALLTDQASLPKCYGREDLYDAYGMKSWAVEVNAIWENK